KVKERRMQGDVTKVERLSREIRTTTTEDPDQLIRDALRTIWWQRSTGILASNEMESLRRVEPRLADAATRDSEMALAGLQAIRRLVGGRGNVGEELPILERALWQLLPPAQPLPKRTNETSPELADFYFRALQSGESKP